MDYLFVCRRVSPEPQLKILNQDGSDSKRETENKRDPFMCTICGKTFARSRCVKSHEKRVHDRLILAQCHICQRAFTDKSNFTNHMKLHFGRKDYVCQHCGKKFVQSQGLRQHLRSHTSYFPFKCEICQREFRTKNHLVSHATSHTELRPFVCDICGKSWRLRGDLIQHEKRYHNGSSVMHACPRCGKLFFNSAHRRRHTASCQSNPNQ